MLLPIMSPTVSTSEAVRAFAKIGLLSFGGPAAQISLMHRVLVEEKNWVSDRQFLHGLNFCMLLPGPEAMQLATYIGWLLHGVRGGLIAGLLFILPGLAMMLALSAVFVVYGDLPFIAGILFGLEAAVLAIVLQAIMKLSAKALGSWFLYLVASLAFVAIFVFGVPFPVIILAAGIAGFASVTLAPKLLPNHGDSAFEDRSNVEATISGLIRQTLHAFFAWGGGWIAALLLIMVLIPDSFASESAQFFSKMALVTFGGAYAVLAYVGQQAVDIYGWLTAADMLQGLGLAETTLGPLVLVLVFVGFVGGANSTETISLLHGLGGGLIAAFFTFAPCFLWIFAGAPHIERLRNTMVLSAGLTTITAAVVGVIANLAVWFGVTVIFGPLERVSYNGIDLPVIDFGGFDLRSAIIAAISAVALIGFKMNLLALIGISALLGSVATQMF